MSLERTVLVGVREPALEAVIRKLVTKLGFRGRYVRKAQECLDLASGHSFLCAFFDRAFFREISRSLKFSFPAYVVLLVEPQDAGAAITLQAKGEIHDWMALPLDAAQGVSLFSKARAFVRISSELTAIRSAATEAIRTDANLLCTGKWADQAERWIGGVADSPDPVLLIGEAGSGKRLLGRLIHYGSRRAGSPYVMVKCHSENPEQSEREIFGEIPGKNGGSASPVRGRFSQAGHGTLFFDRVERLPKRLQQRLARVIQAGRFSPLGGGECVALEARLVFSTQAIPEKTPVASVLHPDLAKCLKRSLLHIPPLRDRMEDFPLIVKSVLEKLRRDRGARPSGVSPGALELLKKHPWEGNIRELEGVLWAASVIAGRGNISSRMLTPFLSNGTSALADEEKALEEIVEERVATFFRRFGVEHLENLHSMFLDRVEKALVKQVLSLTGGSQVEASRILGINRNTLRRKLQEYRIET